MEETMEKYLYEWGIPVIILTVWIKNLLECK